MNQLTPILQKFFDTVVPPTIAQGQQSIHTHSTLCVYKGPENRKCVIGHAIPDEDYQVIFDHPEDEDADTGILHNIALQDYLVAKWEVPHESRSEFIDFLTDLQRIHDVPSSFENPQELTENFRTPSHIINQLPATLDDTKDWKYMFYALAHSPKWNLDPTATGVLTEACAEGT